MEEKCGARGNGSSTWKLADGILLQRPVKRGLVLSSCRLPIGNHTRLLINWMYTKADDDEHPSCLWRSRRKAECKHIIGWDCSVNLTDSGH